MAFSIIGCSKETSKNKDEQQLEQLYTKIKTLAESSICGTTTNYELKFIGIGSKACGGPTRYLAYSSSINVEEFEHFVKRYTALQSNYNKKWGIVSTCDITPLPKAVTCENGKPKLIY